MQLHKVIKVQLHNVGEVQPDKVGEVGEVGEELITHGRVKKP